MKAQSNARYSPEALRELLGPPPLMQGEDEQRYWRLYQAVEDQVQPENFFDILRVKDLTDKVWEQLRNKSVMAALTETCFIKALSYLLVQRVPSIQPDPETARLMAKAYYNRNTPLKRKQEIDAILLECGITFEQIQAKAMECSWPSLSILKNFDYRDDKLIRKYLKEQESIAAKRAKQKPVSSESS